jgi:hypothetical protein
MSDEKELPISLEDVEEQALAAAYHLLYKASEAVVGEEAEKFTQAAHNAMSNLYYTKADAK